MPCRIKVKMTRRFIRERLLLKPYLHSFRTDQDADWLETRPAGSHGEVATVASLTSFGERAMRRMLAASPSARLPPSTVRRPQLERKHVDAASPRRTGWCWRSPDGLHPGLTRSCSSCRSSLHAHRRRAGRSPRPPPDAPTSHTIQMATATTLALLVLRRRPDLAHLLLSFTTGLAAGLAALALPGADSVARGQGRIRRTPSRLT